MEPFASRVVEVDGQKILLPELMGFDKRTIGVHELKRIAMESGVHVLVLGETGTGKDAIAKLIFQEDRGANGEKRTINCAGLSDERANSDLFGHTRGAYTGADDNRKGLFRTCMNGVVFLDEIGELPKGVQHKLLRYLETYEVQPLGSDTVEISKTRVVGATNSSIERALLHDLVPRFTFVLGLPNLDGRKRDIFWLLEQKAFLGNGRYHGISLRAVFLILAARWEENIRGLQNSCKRWCIVGTGVKHGNPAVLDLLEMDYTKMDYRFEALWYLLARIDAAGWLDEGLDGPGRREVCRILLLLIDSGSENNAPPAIPIKELSSLAEGESGRYDLNGLAQLCISHEKKFIHVMVGEGMLVDLATLLLRLEMVFSIYGSMDEIHKEVVKAPSINFQDMKRERIRPREGFIERLRVEVEEVRLWGEIPDEGTDSEDELESVMDRHQITGEERLICLLCADGLSNAKIAADTRVRMSSSTVGERLSAFREHEDLAPFIPPKSSGRRKRQT